MRQNVADPSVNDKVGSRVPDVADEARTAVTANTSQARPASGTTENPAPAAGVAILTPR